MRRVSFTWLSTMALAVIMALVTGARAGEACEITDLIAYSVEDALESRVEPFPACNGGAMPDLPAEALAQAGAAPVRVPVPVETAQVPDVHEYGGYTVQTVEAPDPAWYVRAQGGVPLTWTYETNKFALQTRPGYAFDGGVGRRVASWGPFRLDAEFAVGYRRGPIEGMEANLNVLRFTGNGVLTIGQGWLQPYALAGVGYVASSFEPVDVDVLSITDHGYGYNAGGGVKLRVTKNILFDVRALYEGDEGISIGGKIGNDHANSVERVTFLAGVTVPLGR